MHYGKILLPLLLLASLTGCAAQEVPVDTAAVTETAAETTEAASETTEAAAETTEAASVTDVASAQASTELDIEDIRNMLDTVVSFDDYESFRKAFSEIHPELELYAPPEDSGFKVKNVSACSSNYMLNLIGTDDESRRIGLEMDYATHYDTIEDYYAMFTGSYTLGSPKFEIINDRYLLEHYDNGKVVMYGITGEDNMAFALIAAEDTPEGIAELEEIYQKLGL